MRAPLRDYPVSSRRVAHGIAAVALVIVSAACGREAPVDDTGAPTSASAAPSAPAVTETTVPATSPMTSAPPAMSSTAAVPATTEPATTTTASTPPPLAPSAGVAVVYASDGGDFAWLPVGWWDGAAWGSVDWPEAVAPSLPSTTLDRVSIASVELPDGPLRDLEVAPALYGCIDEPRWPSFVLPVDLPEPPLSFGYRALAVNADWDIQPRPVRAVGLDAPEYQVAGEALVPTDQPVDPSGGDVVQVLRADLDGDGIEEVLFTFERWTDTTGIGVSGDFSLVAGRYADAAGGVVDEVLVANVIPPDFDFPQPARSRIVAMGDLNGDGRMEVALASVYWESADVVVYEFRDGSLQRVMSSGCGS